MDWRRFTAKEETLTLPWWGGGSIDAPKRRLRLATPPEAAGWWTVKVVGRVATVTGPAEAPDLSTLPTVRGHLVVLDGVVRVMSSGASCQPVQLLPAEEPPLFSPVVTRRWHSGDLLFERLEFEGETEEAARRALEEHRGLEGVSGVAATLRAAFVTAQVAEVARRRGVPVSAAEVRQQLPSLLQGGVAGAEAFVQALTQERELVARELAFLAQTRRAGEVAAAMAEERKRRREAWQAAGGPAEAQTRAEEALDGSGARLMRARRLDDERLEVTFTFMGERFVTVVDPLTLQVLDAGICLGHPPADRELTLDSLPGVIREAMDTEALVITRHG